MRYYRKQDFRIVKCYTEFVLCSVPNKEKYRTRQICKVFSKGWCKSKGDILNFINKK